MVDASRCLLLVFIAFIFIPTASAEDWSKFRHDLKNTGCYEGESSLSYDNLSLLWIFETDGWVRSSPAVADINNDNKLEIVFGSDNGFLYALDFSRAGLWSFQTGGRIRSSPLIADINNDDKVEIIFGSDDGFLYVLNSEGSLLWSFRTEGAIVSSPVAVDINDGFGMEIVFGSMDENLYILNPKGEVLKKFELKGAVESSPAIADFDRDGRLDIIVGTNSYNAYVLSYPGTKRMAFSTEGKVVASPVIVGSTPRIVIASTSGKVYALKYSESKVNEGEGYIKARINHAWNYSTENEIVSSAAAGNLVGSGYEEIVFGSMDKNLYVLDAYNGKLLKKYLTNAPICSSPAIANIDGENGSEIIFGSDDGMLYIMNSSWERVWSYECKGAIKTSPVIADLNDDGRSEIIVGADDNRLYVFSSVERLPATTTTTTSTTTSTTPTTSTSTTSTTPTTTTTLFVKPEIKIEEIGSPTTLTEDAPPVVGRVIGVSVNAGLTLLIVFFISLISYILYRRGRRI
ncbi:MAG: hypothetical protein A7315_07525 [Candidatus Altiarchaeales archaeon WOR_SM1_79]|nr:MAG: hypothetical protein A7315_07525 [Candidatus Altiarchaeales archaeon WOR_SM1_79]